MLQLVCENIIKKDEKTESVKTEEFEGPNCTLKNRKLHRRRERAPPQSPPHCPACLAISAPPDGLDPAGERPHGPSTGGEPRLRPAAQRRRQQHGLLLPWRRGLPLAPPPPLLLGRRHLQRAPHAERRRARRGGQAGAGHGLAERLGGCRRRGRRRRCRPPAAAAPREVRSRPTGAWRQRRLPARPHHEISLPCGILSLVSPQAASRLKNTMS
jgi:hypothetical protein